MRIHEAAKKYKMSNDELMALLHRAGFEVSNHMSGMTYDMVEAIERLSKPRKAKGDKAKKAVKKTTSRRGAKDEAKPLIKLVRRRKPKEEPAPKILKVAKAKEAKEAKEAEEAVVAKAAPAVAEKAEKKPEPKAAAKAAAKVMPTPPAEKKVSPAPKKAAPAKETPAKTMAPTESKTKEPHAKKPDARKSDGKKIVPEKTEAPRKAVTPKGPKKVSAESAPAVEAPRRPAAGKPGRRRRESGDEQEKAVRESVRRTLAKMETTRRTKRRKGRAKDEVSTDAPAVKVAEGMTLREIAGAFKLPPTDLIKKCMELGVTAMINQSLDRDVIELLAEDLSINVQFVADEVENLLREAAQVEPSRMTPRAPIVTVMGHVDHGKTSILDYIRKTRVVAGEAGGITQHIGAYEVDAPGGKITFIDTPGHEAFTAMRARGAHITDIVVLVVAADDGVMPQTVEAIAHAKAADVPMIVAINKIDLPTANPTQIKQMLAERDVVVEDFGGDTVCVEVSAKTGEGIDKLLDMILLQAELMELVADREATGQGVAVEVKKEEGRGILCTVLVTQGTLQIGDVFVIGSTYGKVRALLDHRGKPVKKVYPATPVLVLGCNDIPNAGDKLTVVREERDARDFSERRLENVKDRERRASKKLTLEDLYTQIQEGELKELRLIVKGDTNGSVEALTESLGKLGHEEVSMKIIHSGVGVVSESDVLLASSSEALIIGFNVKVSTKGQELAERENVEIKTYSIIYEVLSDVDAAIMGMLEPERIEKVIGRAEVRKVYKVSRVGTIAGSFVTEGAINRNASVKVLRNGDVVFEGRITSLKRFQDDVREVQKDFECGIGVGGFNDIAEGDVIEAYIIEEKARVV